MSLLKHIKFKFKNLLNVFEHIMFNLLNVLTHKGQVQNLLNVL